VGVPVTEWDYECMRTIAFVSDVQLCEDARDIRGFGSASDPILHILFSRGVDNKLLSGFVIVSSCFYGSCIRAMTEFSQTEAAYVNALFTVDSELFMLVSAEIDN
jgi:hypothetical protein